MDVGFSGSQAEFRATRIYEIQLAKIWSQWDVNSTRERERRVKLQDCKILKETRNEMVKKRKLKLKKSKKEKRNHDDQGWYLRYLVYRVGYATLGVQ